MTFGFQLAVRGAPHERMFGDDVEPPRSLRFADPVGAVSVAVALRGDRQELLFRGFGFRSEGAARAASVALRDRLRVSAALGTFGIDVGNDLATSRFGPGIFIERPELLGMLLLPDIHGLAVFEETGQEIRRPRADVAAVVTRNHERLLSNLAAYGTLQELPVRVAVACDLMATADYHPRLEYRLVQMVTATEVLAQPPRRTGTAAALVDALTTQAERVVRDAASAEERASLFPILQGVRGLLRESKSAAARRLAREAVEEGADEAESLIRWAMKERSRFLHDGKCDIESAQLDALRELVRRMIVRSIEAVR